jgi:hypothetical protein
MLQKGSHIILFSHPATKKRAAVSLGDPAAAQLNSLPCCGQIMLILHNIPLHSLRSPGFA